MVIVRALVGDSTMIRDLAMWLHVPQYLGPDYHTHYNKYRDSVSWNLAMNSYQSRTYSLPGS
ncbi:MAG: hypothetical protein LZF60_120061 [Nitrospira sp.]|nr:MAG: hypothetical protein LZF60_120061 [Nitrospira sp.]